MKTYLTLLLMFAPALCHALPPVEPATASKWADVREWINGDGHGAATAGDTGSMLPYLQGGETLLLETYDGQALRRGMLLVFARPDYPLGVVHECIDVRMGWFKTKGLNCSSPDGWFPSSACLFIVRRVIK